MGKVVRPQDDAAPDRIDYFWRGDATPSNALDATVSRVLWKLLAEHGAHGLVVAVEGTPAYDEAAAYSIIGGDESKDVPFDRFLAGWRG